MSKKASDILKEAAEVIEERGKLRDKDDGERSMGRAVEAYNALCGPRLDSELSGWLFMICLKMARATAGRTHEDDYADICGYGALAAECVLSKQDRKAALNELTRVSEELGLYGGCSWHVPVKEDRPFETAYGHTIVPSGNDWILWSGGECPVEEHQVVNFKLRNGGTATRRASCLDWTRDDREWPSDIIAYRVVKE